MKTRPIHENLDTSFVNLSALVRYLRRRQFVGRVRIELSGYEADIFLLAGEQMRVREHDRIAGRVNEGEEALQRLLIRAREPGGTIHVYQTVIEAEDLTVKEPRPTGMKPLSVELPNQFPKISSNGNPHQNQNPDGAKQNPAAKPPANRPNFPFNFTNRVEDKARQAQQLAPQEWRALLQLTGELLGTIDRSLAADNLNFSAALTKVRAEIAADYPFLNPVSGIFNYADGIVTMLEPVSAKLFVASINESLRRILEKLGSSPKFAGVYRATIQNILALIHRRKPLYQKFSITPQLEKIVGA